MPEASRYFSEYFQEFSRNSGEGMKSYCTRHNRVLERLEAALKAVSTPKTSLWNLIRGKVPEKPEIKWPGPPVPTTEAEAVQPAAEGEEEEESGEQS